MQMQLQHNKIFLHITMPTSTEPCSLTCLNHNIFFKGSPCITYPTCPKIFHRVSGTTTTSMTRFIIFKCKSSGSEERETSINSLKDSLSGIVDQQVEELLKREENRALLDGLEKASQRVEMAKMELAEIEKQELEAKQLRDYVDQLETRAFEIAESQREIVEARAILEEAERSLLQNANGVEDGNALVEKASEEINNDVERWESIKAASISAIIGSLAGLPISFTQVNTSSELILPLLITFVSCALFGVTFRYTTRRDLDNIQLKTGTCAAFGFVKGLGALSGGPPLELNVGSFLSHAFDGALYVSEDLLIFFFAAVGLDFCFKMGLLSPFPMKRPASSTNTR